MPVAKLRPPRITPPSATGLRSGGPDDLEALRTGDDLDGVRIEGADLSDLRLPSVTWMETVLVDATMSRTVLPGARLLDVRLDRLDAPDLTAASSKWRDSEVLASRIGALGLYDATVDSLRIAGTKLGYLNLRGSVVADLVVADCPIEELDLSEATLTRATFAGCTIGTLTLRNTTLRDVDLRGARIGHVEPVAGLRGAVLDAGQVLDLAPVLAAGLGIVVA